VHGVTVYEFSIFHFMNCVASHVGIGIDIDMAGPGGSERGAAQRGDRVVQPHDGPWTLHAGPRKAHRPGGPKGMQ